MHPYGLLHRTLFINKHSSVVERGHQLAEGRSSFDSSERMVLVNPHK
uniref:Uncharacterized protein n=2 Tax=Viruses TaxID=10239 RepID=A0AAU8GNU6_9CAUD